MVHEQATDQPCPEQARHSATRRSGHLSGVIKRSCRLIDLYAIAFSAGGLTDGAYRRLRAQAGSLGVAKAA